MRSRAFPFYGFVSVRDFQPHSGMAKVGAFGAGLNAPAEQVLASQRPNFRTKLRILHLAFGVLPKLFFGFQAALVRQERICTIAE